MSYVVDAVVTEGYEYLRRKKQLTPEDQVRADYLLKTLRQIRGNLWMQCLMAIYWEGVVVLTLLGVPALWNLIAFGIKDLFEVAGSIAFISWMTIGFITYYMWLRPRRRRLINKFQHELATDSCLKRVFEVMGFRNP
jgi:hypothetical protein